jgi:hypothetical protein
MYMMHIAAVYDAHVTIIPKRFRHNKVKPPSSVLYVLYRDSVSYYYCIDYI